MNQFEGLCINKTHGGVLVQVSSPGLHWEDERCFFCREKGYVRAFAPSVCLSCVFGFRKITDVAGHCFRSLYGSDLVSIFFGVLGEDVCAKMRPSKTPGLLPLDSDECVWVRLWGAGAGRGVLAEGVASRSLETYRLSDSQNAMDLTTNPYFLKMDDEGRATSVAAIDSRMAFYDCFFEALGGADETLSDTMSGGAP